MTVSRGIKVHIYSFLQLIPVMTFPLLFIASGSGAEIHFGILVNNREAN